ncbi:Pca regulon regulatory protein [Pseudomonas sp. Teo4]|nr:Pca regulon regulatory protein [Pseudomonas sp. Teo4]
MSDETTANESAHQEAARPAAPSLAPPIVASPAKRIQAFTGDPDFMTSLARALQSFRRSRSASAT